MQAAAIAEIVNEQMATKLDILDLKRDIMDLKRDIKELDSKTATKVDIKDMATKLDLKELEMRLTIRMGAMTVVAIGVITTLVKIL